MSDDTILGPSDGDADGDLVEVESMLRALTRDDVSLDEPPDAIWAAIEAELGDTSAADPARVDDADERAAGDVRRDEHVDANVGGNVVPLRRRFSTPMLVAAAMLLIVVGTVTVVASRRSEPTTIAAADLTFDPAAFDPAGASATASVRLTDSAGATLEIDDSALPFGAERDASLEVWMIRVDEGEIVDMVSLGDIEPDGPRGFVVPAGYDPALYSVVDISIEPHDGDPTHSGRSILRGQLA